MNIYVPHQETEVSEHENVIIAQMLGTLGATTYREPDLDHATSMVTSATHFGETVHRQASYVATHLGHDVLLLCNSIERRDALIAELGRRDFSIMAATNPTIRLSALKVHIDSQELLMNMLQRGIRRVRNP